jgi:cytochrome c oxidase assembly factor CtaG
MVNSWIYLISHSALSPTGIHYIWYIMQNLNTAIRKITIKKLILICLLVTAVYYWKDLTNGFVDGMADAGLNFKTIAK